MGKVRDFNQVLGDARRLSKMQKRMLMRHLLDEVVGDARRIIETQYGIRRDDPLDADGEGMNMVPVYSIERVNAFSEHFGRLQLGVESFWLNFQQISRFNERRHRGASG